MEWDVMGEQRVASLLEEFLKKIGSDVLRRCLSFPLFLGRLSEEFVLACRGRGLPLPGIQDVDVAPRLSD